MCEVNISLLLTSNTVLISSHIVQSRSYSIFNGMFLSHFVHCSWLDIVLIQFPFLHDQSPNIYAIFFPLSCHVNDVSKTVFTFTILLLIRLLFSDQQHPFSSCIIHSLIHALITYLIMFYHELTQYTFHAMHIHLYIPQFLWLIITYLIVCFIAEVPLFRSISPPWCLILLNSQRIEVSSENGICFFPQYVFRDSVCINIYARLIFP